MRSAYLCCVLSLCAALPRAGRAQSQELPVWRIELRGAPAPGVGRYSAELANLQHERVAIAFVNSDECLEFRSIAPGDYYLTVSDESGALVYQGMVNVHTGDLQQTLELADSTRREQNPGGLVSVNELRHPPARKALEAAVAAQKLAREGKFAESVQQLEKAIRISPDFAAAHTNLAAEEIRLGRFEDAVMESRRAMALAQPNTTDFGNLAYAEYRLGRRVEAIQAAKEGLQIDQGSANLHYILGTLLALDPATAPESVPHLEIAARTIPRARANLDLVRKQLR